MVPHRATGPPVDTLDAVIGGPRLHARPVDGDPLDRAVQVAWIAPLRAYDAVYLALALISDEAILTLDGGVVERCCASFTALRVFGSR